MKDLLSSISKDKNSNFKLPELPTTTSHDSKLNSKDLEKLNDLVKRLPALESLFSELEERVGINESRIEGHDKDLSEIMKLLNEKADKSIANDVGKLQKNFDEINRELEQFNSLRNEIEQINKRCDSTDRNLTSLEERMEMIKESINSCLRDVENLLKTLKEDLKKLEEESNTQGGLIIKINQRIDVLEIKIDNIDKSFAGGLIGSSGLGKASGDVKELQEILDILKRDFMSFKEDNYKRNKEVEEELEKKVDKADLIEFERLMRERMEANEKSLLKAKTDLRKALRNLEDKLKNISNQFTSRGASIDREDALLSKKPLEGWKCATCDKDLVNMIGLPAEHYNWRKMPKKEGERIPMMGQGFSRMLMTLNHNSSTSHLEKHSKTFYSPKAGDEDSAFNESPVSSRNVKLRSSIPKVDKDGSTTVENSILPQIKKKNKSGLN